MKIQQSDQSWTELQLYTNENLLKSNDCLFYSLDGWRIHGCYTIKKKIFEKSYLDYLKYNSKLENYVNNDEVITRLNFFNSSQIVRCEAFYYYCYNKNSTTKKINPKKYLMINNADILYEIFVIDEQLRPAVKAELVGVLWGTFSYMHRYKLDLDNLNEWQFLLKQKIKDIRYLEFLTNLGFKKKIQLTLLKLVYLL